MTLADQAHPKIGTSRARLVEAEAMVSEAESGLYPTLSYQAGALYWNDDLKLEDVPFPGGSEQDFIFQGQQQFRASVDFRWPVYTWDRVQNATSAAEHEVEARQLEVLRTRETAINSAILSYWTLASAKEAQSYLAATLNELRLFLETAQEDMNNGAKNAPQKDVIQIKIDIHTMEAWRNVLHRWAESSRQALSIATGVPLEQMNIKDSEVKYNPIRVSYDQCLASAFRHRADLQAIERRVQEAALLIEVQEKANYPDVALVSRARLLEDDYGPSQNLIGMVGLEIQGVLVDGSRNSAKTDQARARYSILKHQQNEIRAAIRQEVRDAYLTVKESYNAVIQYNFAREQTMAKLTVVRDGYPLLLSTVKDVQETQVERRFRDKDYIFSKLKLIKALATLNLVAGSTVYDFALLESLDDSDQIGSIQ
jgi:outer membrane protein TolC